MTHYFKALGLTLAIVALTASPASAVDMFTVAGGGTARLTATSSDNAFEIKGSTYVECTTSAFSGTVKNGAQEATLTVAYSGTLEVTPHTTHCTLTGMTQGSANVDMNECAYVLSGKTNGTYASFWIECKNVGEHILLTTSTCKIKIPAQTPTSGGVTYTNQTDGVNKDVLVTFAAEGITYTTEGVGCALDALEAEANNAEYHGTATLKGYADPDDGVTRKNIEVS